MAKGIGVGKIAYMIGIFGSIILGALGGLGFFEMGAIFSWILILAGLTIGFFNISDKEATSVMIASLVLGVSTGVLANLPFVADFLISIFSAMTYVVLPIALVTAVKIIWEKTN